MKMLRKSFFIKTTNIVKEQQLYKQILHKGVDYIPLLKSDTHTYTRRWTGSGEGHVSHLQSTITTAKKLAGEDHQRHRCPTRSRNDVWGRYGKTSQQRFEMDVDEGDDDHRRRTEDEDEIVQQDPQNDAWGRCRKASQWRLELDVDEDDDDHRRRIEDEDEIVADRKKSCAQRAKITARTCKEN